MAVPLSGGEVQGIAFVAGHSLRVALRGLRATVVIQGFAAAGSLQFTALDSWRRAEITG
jgi:hypothetical protein